MPLAEALALLPHLISIDHDPAADHARLLELADWSQRFSPFVGVEESSTASSLHAEVAGFAECFGGEEALLRQACRDYGDQGWNVSLTIADTWGAAWAVAHYPSSLDLFDGVASGTLHDPQRQTQAWYARIAPGESAQVLAGFPIASLRLPDPLLGLLARLGIERIGQIMALPRDEVIERFGPELFIRLGQALGEIPEILVPYHSQPVFDSTQSFDDPLHQIEAVLIAIQELLVKWEEALDRRQQGVRLLECELRPEIGERVRIECRFARPVAQTSYMTRLMRPHFENLQLTSPIQQIRLRGVVLERIPREQKTLFDERDVSRHSLDQLIDHLSARYGRDAVMVPRLHPDPQPELACRYQPAIDATLTMTDDFEMPRAVQAARPLRLFQPPILIEVWPRRSFRMPEQFDFAGNRFSITGGQGPERIDTGWWRGDDVQRDYYRVETSDGARWWIFQDRRDERWYLHGCFE